MTDVCQHHIHLQQTKCNLPTSVASEFGIFGEVCEPFDMCYMSVVLHPFASVPFAALGAVLATRMYDRTRGVPSSFSPAMIASTHGGGQACSGYKRGVCGRGKEP